MQTVEKVVPLLRLPSVLQAPAGFKFHPKSRAIASESP